MSRLHDRLRSSLLTVLTGSPDGRSPWVDELLTGDDEGYFGPESAAWVVHGDLPTMVAGIRALLMQTLHPGAMAGVHDHSRYKTDAAGRLAGTIRWIIAVTFGSTEQARRESGRVDRFHDRVTGAYETTAGEHRAYAARDPELLNWVHLAFTEAFLGCQQTWGRAIPGGPDAYVREWAIAGELVGATATPRSEAELRAALDDFRVRGILRRDARVEEAVRFLRRPPNLGGGVAYRILFAGAIASIPRPYRELLGARRAWWPAITLTRAVLALIGWILSGGESSRELASRRVARLRASAGAA